MLLGDRPPACFSAPGICPGSSPPNCVIAQPEPAIAGLAAVGRPAVDRTGNPRRLGRWP